MQKSSLWRLWLLALGVSLLIGVAAVAIVGARASEPETVRKLPRPPIDAQAPAHLETATFGMG